MKTSVKLIALFVAAIAFNASAMTPQQQSMMNAHAAVNAYNAKVSAYNKSSTEANNAAKGSIYGGMNSIVEHGTDPVRVENDQRVSIAPDSQIVSHGSISQRVENGQMASIAGTSQTVANTLSVTENHASRPASINVSAASLAPSTPVSVTDKNGVTSVTTAGQIAATAPETQISVPHVPAFQRTSAHGNDHDRASHHSQHIGHEGRGAENAQASAHNSPNGRAHGL